MGPEAHPATQKMGSRDTLPGINWQEVTFRGVQQISNVNECQIYTFTTKARLTLASSINIELYIIGHTKVKIGHYFLLHIKCICPVVKSNMAHMQRRTGHNPGLFLHERYTG
jgi:hypothetical protein